VSLDADRREHEGSLLGIGKRAEPTNLDQIGHAIIRDVIGGAFLSSRLSHPGDHVELAGSGRSNCSISATGQPYPEGSPPPPRSRLTGRVFNRFYAFS
jgi:hypothetical protein